MGIEEALRLCWGTTPEWMDSGRAPALEFGEKESRSLMGALLSVACLLAAFDLCVTMDAGAYASRPQATARAAAPADPDAREAISLAQEWRLAGDELPVLERLRGVARNPGSVRAWSAEKTETDAYLVIFREPSGGAYAFEVDLGTGRVLTTPEAVERLTEMRVREESAALQSLVASAR